MAANDDAKQEQGHGDAAAQGGKKIAMIITKQINNTKPICVLFVSSAA